MKTLLKPIALIISIFFFIEMRGMDAKEVQDNAQASADTPRYEVNRNQTQLVQETISLAKKLFSFNDFNQAINYLNDVNDLADERQQTLILLLQGRIYKARACYQKKYAWSETNSCFIDKDFTAAYDCFKQASGQKVVQAIAAEAYFHRALLHFQCFGVARSDSMVRDYAYIYASKAYELCDNEHLKVRVALLLGDILMNHCLGHSQASSDSTIDSALSYYNIACNQEINEKVRALAKKRLAELGHTC